MSERNKLSTYFNGKEQMMEPSNQLVNDPRIDSPEVQVIHSQETPLNRETEEDKPQEVFFKKKEEDAPILDLGTLDEVQVTVKKEERKEEDEHVCEVGFGQAFKQNWISIVSITLAMGIIGFIVGRVTKKVS